MNSRYAHMMRDGTYEVVSMKFSSCLQELGIAEVVFSYSCKDIPLRFLSIRGLGSLQLLTPLLLTIKSVRTVCSFLTGIPGDDDGLGSCGCPFVTTCWSSFDLERKIDKRTSIARECVIFDTEHMNERSDTNSWRHVPDIRKAPNDFDHLTLFSQFWEDGK
jgi:hypothetical protein